MDSKILHHYSNSKGVKGIISSKSLHFTHYKHVGDPSEREYGLKKILEFMRRSKFYDDVSEKLAKNDKKFPSQQIDQYITSILISSENVQIWEPYIACLCDISTKEAKHGYLTMWREYRKEDPIGCAIEFSEHALDKLIDNSFGYKDLIVIGLRVEYIEEEDENIIHKVEKVLIDLIKGMKDETKKLFQLPTSDNEEEIKQAFSELLINDITSLVDHVSTGRKENLYGLLLISTAANFIKHSAYRDEREYRICIGYPTDKNKDAFPKTLEKLLKHKSNANSEKIPYLDIEIPEIVNAISKILIGPKQEEEGDYINGIKESLKENNLSIPVIKSTIPHK